MKSRRMVWTGHVSCTREKRTEHKVLVGNLESKIPLGRCKLRWDDNIKIDLRELGWGGMD
jgi:hypothetical protein